MQIPLYAGRKKTLKPQKTVQHNSGFSISLNLCRAASLFIVLISGYRPPIVRLQSPENTVGMDTVTTVLLERSVIQKRSNQYDKAGASVMYQCTGGWGQHFHEG